MTKFHRCTGISGFRVNCLQSCCTTVAAKLPLVLSRTPGIIKFPTILHLGNSTTTWLSGHGLHFHLQAIEPRQIFFVRVAWRMTSTTLKHTLFKCMRKSNQQRWLSQVLYPDSQESLASSASASPVCSFIEDGQTETYNYGWPNHSKSHFDITLFFCVLLKSFLCVTVFVHVAHFACRNHFMFQPLFGCLMYTLDVW